VAVLTGSTGFGVAIAIGDSGGDVTVNLSNVSVMTRP
jgi:hypothetical protein